MWCNLLLDPASAAVVDNVLTLFVNVGLLFDYILKFCAFPPSPLFIIVGEDSTIANLPRPHPSPLNCMYYIKGLHFRSENRF